MFFFTPEWDESGDIDMISCPGGGAAIIVIYMWISPVSGVVGFLPQICKNLTKPCKGHDELARLTHTHTK